MQDDVNTYEGDTRVFSVNKGEFDVRNRAWMLDLLEIGAKTAVTEVDIILYGLLYNWWVAAEVNYAIAGEGWHVPTEAELLVLINYLGGLSVSGGKLKEIGTTYWDSPNVGATNEVGFYSRGTGARDGEEGTFGYLKTYHYLWTADSIDPPYDFNAVGYRLARASAITTYSATRIKKEGMSIRLVKDNSVEAQYTGNDGKVYDCIKIGDQVWLASNLAETKYRNGDLIPEVTDNAAWAALTTAGMCYYNNVEI